MNSFVMRSAGEGVKFAVISGGGRGVGGRGGVVPVTGINEPVLRPRAKAVRRTVERVGRINRGTDRRAYRISRHEPNLTQPRPVSVSRPRERHLVACVKSVRYYRLGRNRATGI